MLVKMLLAVCGFVGVVVSEKAAFVSSVYCFHFVYKCMSGFVVEVCI